MEETKTYLTLMIIGGDIEKSELDKITKAIQDLSYSCHFVGNGNIRFEKIKKEYQCEPDGSDKDCECCKTE